jgi:hypothetical protein
MTDATVRQSPPPDRIASVLGCGIAGNLVEGLAGSPRFKDRLIALMASRLGDIGNLHHEQARILAMHADELSDLSHRAGCTWHAGSIVRIIDGASRNLLVSLLGTNNYEAALAHIGLQPPDAAILTPEEIAGAVLVDGAACLAAWCELQPSAVAARLRLIGPLASPKTIHKAWGPQIISRLLVD